MKYTEQQKVTIQSEDWYNQKKQANGFIIFRDDKNKIATFSPGMLKFCGQTFTVNKVVTGSSIFPDHYTFVEDGGMYKWNDDMILGVADPNAEVYKPDTTQPKPAEVKPQTKPETKPEVKVEVKPQPKPEVKPAEPKPEVKPAVKTEPKSVGVKPKPVVEQPKPQTKTDVSLEPKTVDVKKTTENMKPTVDEMKPVEKPEHSEDEHKNIRASEVSETTETEITAFESYSILLKTRRGASVRDCAEQALKILYANSVFPSATFDFNDFTFTITRR